MALKDIFKMTKANRYTADGREELIKAQEAVTEDRRYNIGEISEKTGLQKTANGWAKPKNGAGRNLGTEQKKRGPGAIHTPGKGNVGMDKMKEAAEKGLKGQELKEFMTGSKSESKPAESTSSAPKTESKPAEKTGYEKLSIYELQDKFNSNDGKVLNGVMKEEHEKVKKELEKRTSENKPTSKGYKKGDIVFDRYGETSEVIATSDNYVYVKNSRGRKEWRSEDAFEGKKNSEATDSAPRVLTGDTRIRVRK